MKKNSQEHKIFIREKFDKITKRYDLVNGLGSFYQDHLWRKKTAELFKKEEGPFLDLCCGPFTLTFEILKVKKTQIWALDISLEMLFYGKQKKFPYKSLIFPLKGDSEILPFKDNIFGGISLAFGFRNFLNRERALQEFHRVLRKGGLLVILEFSLPKNSFFKRIYIFYLKYLLSSLGGLLTGDKVAYDYLVESIQQFPSPEKVHLMLERQGFRKEFLKPLTLGVVTLYAYRKV